VVTSAIITQEALSDRIAEQEKRIARHADLEAELKICKKIIKEIKERKEKLVEEARNKIDSDKARQLILARWERTFYATVDEYLAQYRRYLRPSLENLWEKYHQPLHSILKERDAASVELAGYLMEWLFAYFSGSGVVEAFANVILS
jgi:type I restriction enzyme M protein